MISDAQDGEPGDLCGLIVQTELQMLEAGMGRGGERLVFKETAESNDKLGIKRLT